MARGIPPRVYGAIDKTIEALRDRMIAHLRPNLTYEDFLRLFVAPDEREICRLAPTVCNLYQTRSAAVPNALGLPLLSLHMDDSKGTSAPLIPKNLAIQDDAPSELVARITPWVIERLSIGTDFGLVKVVLARLDHECTGGPSQLRYMWPSILSLCSLDENLTPFADAIRGLRQPKSIPSLPPEWRDACRQSAATIAAALLLPTTAPPASMLVVDPHHLGRVIVPVGTITRI